MARPGWRHKRQRQRRCQGNRQDLDDARRMQAAAASRARGYGGPADCLATTKKNPGANMHHVLQGTEALRELP
jgi:hypothetical protein